MINTSSTPPLGAAASRPPPPSSPAPLPSPMNYLIVVFSSSPQVKTGQRTQRRRCPLCAPVNPIVTLIIARGRCHHRRVALPAFAVPPLPPAFAVLPSAPSPPLQIVDCCVGHWSSPPLSREAGTAVIIRAAPSHPLAGCRCQGVAPSSSPRRLDERPPPRRLQMALPLPPLPQNVDYCVGGRPLLRQGRRGRPSSLGWRHYVLWRAVVVRASPPHPLLGGSTSGLLLGGYEWPCLRRPYHKILILVLVAVPSFVKGGGDSRHR
jgi:hypothetical protein